MSASGIVPVSTPTVPVIDLCEEGDLRAAVRYLTSEMLTLSGEVKRLSKELEAVKSMGMTVGNLTVIDSPVNISNVGLVVVKAGTVACTNVGVVTHHHGGGALNLSPTILNVQGANNTVNLNRSSQISTQNTLSLEVSSGEGSAKRPRLE